MAPVGTLTGSVGASAVDGLAGWHQPGHLVWRRVEERALARKGNVAVGGALSPRKAGGGRGVVGGYYYTDRPALVDA